MAQTYDGELHTGTLKLLWHRKAINPQALQVLRRRQRGFPFAPSLSLAPRARRTGTGTGAGAGAGQGQG